MLPAACAAINTTHETDMFVLQVAARAVQPLPRQPHGGQPAPAPARPGPGRGPAAGRSRGLLRGLLRRDQHAQRHQQTAPQIRPVQNEVLGDESGEIVALLIIKL